MGSARTGKRNAWVCRTCTHRKLAGKRNASSKQIGIAKSKGEDVSTIARLSCQPGDELKTCETNLAALQKT